ncbi:hypothetical protein CEXT_135101 [Caerostris extrusa]|uniref:Uncharacterized protein n=1 Tax=Caerostris extrusa TaxID=172846 RepID=A0AAV4ULG5_CAEEX|nr:hypothetical protein CEXT_135101 [Caerostris extrusa]
MEEAFDDPLFKMQAGRRTIHAVEEHLSSPDILERGLSSRNINSAQPGFFPCHVAHKELYSQDIISHCEQDVTSYTSLDSLLHNIFE